MLSFLRVFYIIIIVVVVVTAAAAAAAAAASTTAATIIISYTTHPTIAAAIVHSLSSSYIYISGGPVATNTMGTTNINLVFILIIQVFSPVSGGLYGLCSFAHVTCFELLVD